MADDKVTIDPAPSNAELERQNPLPEKNPQNTADRLGASRDVAEPKVEEHKED